MARIVNITNEDMFADYMLPDVLYVVTTNGFVKTNGTCVMGRGTAKMAAELHPTLPAVLGDLILGHGNRPYMLPGNMMSLPVKHVWNEPADPMLIRRSLQQASILLRLYEHDGPVFVPRPGCGNGQLKWEDMRDMVEGLIAATWPVSEVAIFGLEDGD